MKNNDYLLDLILSEKRTLEKLSENENMIAVMFIRVNFKSGNSGEFWVKSFDIKKEFNKITKMNWESLFVSDCPVFIDIAEIESVVIIDQALLPISLIGE